MAGRIKKLSIQQRADLLQAAKRLGNVSEACDQFGVSRPYFYKLRARVGREGAAGLEDPPRAQRQHPRKLTPEHREAIAKVALLRPWLGCQTLAKAYIEMTGFEVSGVTVHRVLKDFQLETLAQRIEESTRWMLTNPEIRTSEAWDYVRQKNPLLEYLLGKGSARCDVFHAAFLPVPNRRPDRNGADEDGSGPPWAFVMMDGSSGYSFGKVSPASDQAGNWWMDVIESVRHTCELIRASPKAIQIGSFPDHLARWVAGAMHRAFPGAEIEIRPQADLFRFGWVGKFDRYARETLPLLGGSRARSTSAAKQLLNDLLNEFNDGYRNRGFPNFGQVPSDLFWPKHRISQ